MSPLTSTLTLQEAHHGHCSTLAMPSTLRPSKHPAPMQPDSACAPGNDRTRHHARHVPLGRQRRRSYRTSQRFFATIIPWGILFWVFFRHYLYCPGDVYLVAGDDVIVTKAGTCTHGLDRFFASLYGKPVPGLAFVTLSRVRVQARRAFPLRLEPVVRSDAEQAASKATAAAKQSKAPCAKRRPGRPKGSKNKPKADGPFTPE